MSILGLIILAIIWAVYLGWYTTQSRSHRHSGDSIASFRNQLATLERGRPGRDFLDAARGSLPLGFGRPSSRSPRAMNGFMDRSRTGLTPIPGTFMGSQPRLGQPNMSGSPMVRRGAPARLSGVRKRRRDVLVGLLSAAGFTLVFGVLPPLRWLWLVNLLVDAVLVAYVVMLIQIRNQAAERELKVRFLPSAAPMPSMMHKEPALTLRRTAAN